MKYLLGLLLLLSLPSSAEDAAIVVYGNEDKPPKIWLEDGKPRGILVDMMSWISEQSGQRYQIDLYPWNRAYKLAEAAQGAIVGLSMTKARLEIFDYSAPIFYDEMVLVALAGKVIPYEKLEDLQGKRIAVLRGASFGDKYDRGVNEGIFTAVTVNSPRQGMYMMREGRVDLVLVGPGRVSVEKVFESDPKLAAARDTFEILPNSFYKDSNHVGFAKTLDQKKYLQELNHYISKGWESGEFDRIVKQHLN